MPTMRLLLLITGSLRTLSCSMCRTALARSSSSRQQWMPGVITSRAVARRASKLSSAKPLQTMSRSVTIPISRSFSPIGMAPISLAAAETEALGLRNVEFRKANVLEPWPTTRVSFVLIRFVLTHLASPETLLAHALAALKPGGVLAVEDIDYSGQFSEPPSPAFDCYRELYVAAAK